MLSELQHLKEAWDRAWLEKDAATVERLMAEDYVYVAPNGHTLDRATILGIIRSPSYRIHHGTWTEVHIRPLSDQAAVIRDRWQGEGTYEGKTFKDDHHCLRVCARVEGQWQVVMEQCTANSR
jgi:hypothetical protein